MIPKIELIKKGLSNVRGGCFNFTVAVESPKEDCVKDCLCLDDQVVGSVKGRVTHEQELETQP